MTTNSGMISLARNRSTVNSYLVLVKILREPVSWDSSNTYRISSACTQATCWIYRPFVGRLSLYIYIFSRQEFVHWSSSVLTSNRKKGLTLSFTWDKSRNYRGCEGLRTPPRVVEEGQVKLFWQEGSSPSKGEHLSPNEMHRSGIALTWPNSWPSPRVCTQMTGKPGRVTSVDKCNRRQSFWPFQPGSEFSMDANAGVQLLFPLENRPGDFS